LFSRKNRFDSVDLENKLSEINTLVNDESVLFENTVDAMNKYIAEDLLDIIFKSKIKCGFELRYQYFFKT
jgi:hypothetical protein